MQKYYKDYVSEEKITQDGKVVTEVTYRGDYYEYHLSKEEYRNLRKRIVLTTVVIGILFLLAGSINNNGSFSLYVVLPYLCLLPGLFYLIFGFIRMPRKLEKINYAIYDQSYLKVKFALVGIIAASITTLVGDTIFIINNYKEIGLVRELGFWLIHLVIALVSIVLLRYHNRIVCEKVHS